jgi:hypothetical protein
MLTAKGAKVLAKAPFKRDGHVQPPPHDEGGVTKQEHKK